MLHAVTMSVTGLSVVAPGNWEGKGLLSGRHELVAAFLGLELAFLLQACTRFTACPVAVHALDVPPCWNMRNLA